MIRSDGTYYMFYECYSTIARPILVAYRVKETDGVADVDGRDGVKAK